MSLPNVFIIGVQKAGTTTVHDWLSQHPDVYGPNELKDINFFVGSDGLLDAKDILKKIFIGHEREPVLLQTYVNYFFYPAALENIASLCPSAKLIVLLRDPVERTFSAYRYFKKMGRETRGMKDALLYTPKYPVPFSRDNSDFTYIEHGLYFLQLDYCLKYFNEDQILLLDFDELKSSPKNVLLKIYHFLGIREHWFPELKPRNMTGDGIRFKWIQKTLLESGPLRKWMINGLLDWWLPVGKRKNIKQKLFEWNTRHASDGKKNQSDEDLVPIVSHLKAIFKEDVRRLDNKLGTNYIRKWDLDI